MAKPIDEKHEREYSLHEAAIRIGISRTRLTAMCDQYPTLVTHRVRSDGKKRRIYIPYVEVQRLRGQVFQREEKSVASKLQVQRGQLGRA